MREGVCFGFAVAAIAGSACLLASSVVHGLEGTSEVETQEISTSWRPDPGRRRALFGELHLHTSYSFDAFSFGPSRIDPDMAYRFGRGEVVDYLGKKAGRHAALDFMAVTDHGEYMGFLNTVEDPNSELASSSFKYEYDNMKKSLRPDVLSAELQKKLSNPAQMRELGADVAMHSAWQKTIDAANLHYRPGEFTTFIGYEWTSHPGSRYNLHRNVIFSGHSAPLPFSAIDSERPEDLWHYLEDARREGFEVLAIPHNSNGSEGHMFDWVDSDGNPVDARYARRRALNEPLMEIYQGKGQSETHPTLSPNDEFAQFEVMDKLVPRMDLPSKPSGSYAREALGRGLLIERDTGENPFRFGVVGGTDFHNGLTTSAEDAGIMVEGLDPRTMSPDLETARQYLMEPYNGIPDPKIFGSGGLTGVWAEENTRPAIFAALQRREAFATSGTRIRLRLFGGWDYPLGIVERSDWVEQAYNQGVPMGSDLPESAASTSPVFLAWAMKAPDGANLDRIQIVKIWIENEEIQEKIFDIALSDGRVVDSATGKAPPLPSTVDLKTGTLIGTVGARELTAYWRDSEFNPKQAAVYYLRVLEIETPRWTTLLAVRHGLDIPQESAATIQERAWSSPIWYRTP